MSGISIIDIRAPLLTAVGASETDKVISKEFGLGHFETLNLRIDFVCSSVTVGAGITARLQSKAINGAYVDLGSANSSVSILGNGTVSITLNIQIAADQVDMPLQKHCRLLVNTGAGSAVTFDRIDFQRT